MTKEEELLRQIFCEGGYCKLANELPCGYTEEQHGFKGKCPEVDALLDVLVTDEHRAHDDYDTLEEYKTWPEAWPGPEIGIIKWYQLETGHKVGWQLKEDNDWKFIVINP